jgi:protein phosphatase
MNHFVKSEIDSMSSGTIFLRSAALTQAGRHGENKDAVFEHTSQIETGEFVGLYIVCDGFGDEDGEIPASQLAVQTIVGELGRFFAVIDSQADPSLTQPSLLTLHGWLHTAVAQANQKVWLYNQSCYPDNHTLIGTTLTLALIYGNLVRIANIGDSRTYIWHAGQLTQITRDHSLEAELAQAGFILEDKTAYCSQNNVICRAIGPQPGVEMDLFEWQLQPGDKLLLCSDGLWKSFPDTAELGHMLSTGSDPEDLCWQLMGEASYRDDFDDISIVIAQTENPIEECEVQTAHADKPVFEETAVPIRSMPAN